MNPAARARTAAGLSIAEAARLARISEGFLQRIEAGRGTCSYALGKRLAKLYRASSNVFLIKPGGATARTKHMPDCR